jgi:hypothetical protein
MNGVIGDIVLIGCHSLKCGAVHKSNEIRITREFTLDGQYLLKWRCPTCGCRNTEVFCVKTAESTVLSLV